MSLRSDTQVMLDLVMGFIDDDSTTTVKPNSPEADRRAGIAIDFLSLENAILAFRAGAMSGSSMRALKRDLEKLASDYGIA